MRWVSLRWVTCGLIVLGLTGVARAQDVKPGDEETKLKEMKQELKDAQDRRAELAMENQKLLAHVAELDKANKAQAAQLEDLKRQAAGFADQTVFLGSHYAAWKQFIAANPDVRMQWELFLKVTGSGEAPQSLLFLDVNWPLSEE